MENSPPLGIPGLQRPVCIYSATPNYSDAKATTFPKKVLNTLICNVNLVTHLRYLVALQGSLSWAIYYSARLSIKN